MCPVKRREVKYTDFIGANGTNLLGYGNELLGNKLKRRFTDGALLSLSTVLEVEVAEKFKAAVPMIQRLRFLKTGSEACVAAITIARAYTGRAEVLSDGYHGFLHITECRMHWEPIYESSRTSRRLQRRRRRLSSSRSTWTPPKKGLSSLSLSEIDAQVREPFSYSTRSSPGLEFLSTLLRTGRGFGPTSSASVKQLAEVFLSHYGVPK
jgi:hypothetical protein